MAATLPLVHRTVPIDQPQRWDDILRTACIRATLPCTERERRLGSTRAAYFFFGHPAWPSGLVAFILPAHADVLNQATFTPFDSGGVDEHMVPHDPSAGPLDDDAKDDLLRDHVGAGAELHAVAAPFIATHVRESERYIWYAQDRRPDWPEFHGYTSRSPDRRSWTIEVQAHEDVAITPYEERLEALIVGGKSVGLRVSDDLFGLVTEVETEEDVPQAVIRHILAKTENGP